mgnify:CR=1 FL=1
MLKTEDKQKAINEYVDEIKKLYPDATVRIMDDKIYSEDAWVRIEGIHPSIEHKALRRAIRLQSKWYLERGVYIFVTVSGTDTV